LLSFLVAETKMFRSAILRRASSGAHKRVSTTGSTRKFSSVLATITSPTWMNSRLYNNNHLQHENITFTPQQPHQLLQQQSPQCHRRRYLHMTPREIIYYCIKLDDWHNIV
jgi:hypothetical protein